MRLSKLSIGVLFIISFFLFSSLAEARDFDRDGLSDRRERAIKTNPRKADTDRDTLRDGREVRYTKTNPRKADTDGDGVGDGSEVLDGLDPRDPDSDDDGARDIYERKGRIEAITYTESDAKVVVRTKRKTIFQVRIDEKTFLEGLDRNNDSLLTLADFSPGDRVEVNLDPADPTRAQTLELKIDDTDNEFKGKVTKIEGESVSVVNRGGVSKTFTVDIDTLLRAPDRDKDGMRTINDIVVGDIVEVHLDESGEKALSVEVKYSPGEYGSGNGYEDKADEVEGVLMPGFTGSSIVLIKRGQQKTVLINSATKFFGPDRNSDGSITVLDLLPGDKIKARLGSDNETATGIEYKPPGEGGYAGGENREIKGVVVSKEPFVVQGFFGPIELLSRPDTKYEVIDRNSDGSQGLADFQIGDFVEAKFRVSDRSLIELELKMTPPDLPEDSPDKD